MSKTSLADVAAAWHRFRVDLTFAEHYRHFYIDHPGPIPKNPIVERLLPTLLHVKVVALLDAALKTWIDAQGLTVPKMKYRNDLHGRINFLADGGHLPDRAPLHGIRDTRNALAHEAESAINWSQLHSDMAVVHSALSTLGVVGPMPTWNVVSERSEMRVGEVEGTLATMHYSVRIEDGGKRVAAIEWPVHLMPHE